MRADELCGYFALSASIGAAKSKMIMDVLKIRVADPHWTLPSGLADNSLAWLIQVNGMIVDARKLPKDIQEEAVQGGIIHISLHFMQII